MTAGERNLSRRVAAILLAGGSGTRFGADKNKVYVEALGQPLIRYSLDVFAAHPLVDEVILVAREGEKEILESFPCGKPSPCLLWFCCSGRRNHRYLYRHLFCPRCILYRGSQCGN